MNFSIKTALTQLLAVAVITFSVITLQAQEVSKTVKVTDSSLHPINYGIDSLEHWISKAKVGDSSRAATLLRDLKKLEARFDRLPVSGSDQYKYVAKRLKEARAAINEKSAVPSRSEADANNSREESISRRSNPELANIGRMLANVQQDISRYRDNHKQRSRMRSDLQTLKKRFDRVAVSSHPDYLDVRKQLKEVEEALLLSGGALQLNEQQVTEYVESIRIKYGEKLLLPEARDIMKQRELTSKDVDTIVTQVKTFRDNAKKDLPKLRQVVQATGKGSYWLKWLEKESAEKLARNFESIKKTIDTNINSGLRNAKQRSELDPARNKYAFTTESVRKAHQGEHARTLRTLQQAARLEKLLKLQPTWSPKISEIQNYIALYDAKANSANTVRKLPAEVGTKEHHQIAASVFKIEKYEVGKVVHKIVNSKPVPRDRIEHKASGNKLETIVREWQEYQVTTVEKEHGKLIVYVNNLAKFSRAPATTPINKWILKQRFKRGEISQQDFSTAREQK